jgi:regulatory protein
MFKKKSKSTEREPENPDRGLSYCLFLLNIRTRSEGEIVESMTGRGFTPEVIKTTLERLKELRYVNDKEYAETIIESCKRFKPWGYSRIRVKLMERKIPRAIIESSLEKYFTEADELLIAKEMVKREVKGKRFDYMTKQKLSKKLQGRGFRYSVVVKATGSLSVDA